MEVDALGGKGSLDSQTKLKFLAAQRALKLVEPGMVLGLGSGSTATLWIHQLGEQVRDHGLKVQAVASSEASEQLGQSYGIPFIAIEKCGQIDLTVDGADEIAPRLALIKGGGGKLLREKIVATASRRFVIVADSSKVVQTLGRFPLSVEVIPMAVSLVSGALGELGFKTTVRQNKAGGGNYITDEGNLLLDCSGLMMNDPYRIAQEIDRIVGVVEHGLFLDMANLAIIATDSGVVERET
jgi:ribose 5-phosphate isomerase A